MKTRRSFLYASGAGLAAVLAGPRYAFSAMPAGTDYDVTKYGAVGDGKAVDTAAVQKAIDAAATAGGGRVFLPGGKRFLCGALMLKSGIEFHLGEDAVLLANTDPKDYGTLPGLLNSDGAQGLKITGPGSLDGQARQFMTTYSEADERWEPVAFRPRLLSLLRTKGLEITEITFGRAPSKGVYLLGCESVMIDRLRVRNYMNVPDCTGIEVDRCRDVQISNCDIVGADDCIVVKTSEQKEDFGPSRNVSVKGCVLVSRESALKVGGETFGDISKILFEHCRIVAAGRGPTITHRNAGNLEDIEFRDIELVAIEHHAPYWWGWGEAISVTARPLDGKLGTLRNVRLRNIQGRAENSVRIDGTREQPIEDVLLEKVDITIDKWTDYPGGKFDNRPVAPKAEELEVHDTPVFALRNANKVLVKDCTARWGDHPEKYFSNALQAVGVQGLKLENFNGEAAFPDAQKAVVT